MKWLTDMIRGYGYDIVSFVKERVSSEEANKQ